MEIQIFLTIAVLLHFAFFFTDYLLRSCMCLPYLQLLHHTGLIIKPLQLRITTSLFNRPLAKWALGRAKFTRIWFTCGLVSVLVVLLPSALLLLGNIVQYLASLSRSQRHAIRHGATAAPPAGQQLLQPLVPGVNLGSGDLPVYFITLLVSSVAHEAGHAVAAFKEGVHVDGVGVLLLFVLPGAFVMLSTEAMAALHPYRRLKILCAGVWHNLVLVGLAILMAFLIPTLYSPVYKTGVGAIITEVTKDSPARGQNGLHVLEVVTSINDCRVSGVAGWHSCLLEALVSPQRGYCIPDHIVANMDETVEHVSNGPGDSVRCCRASSDANSGGGDHLCFQLLAATDASGADADSVPMQPFTCLPARPAVAISTMSCVNSVQCPKDHFCFAPSLEEGLRLLRISRSTATGEPLIKPVAPAEPPVDRDHGGDSAAAHPPDKPPYRTRRLTDLTNPSGDHESVAASPVMPVTWRLQKDNKQDKIGLGDVYVSGNSSSTNRSREFNIGFGNTHLMNAVSGETGASLKVDETTSDGDMKTPSDLDTSRRKQRKRSLFAVDEESQVLRDVYSAGAVDYTDVDESHSHEYDVPPDFTDVLFLGSPAHLYQTVTVSDFSPRFPFIPLGLAESALKVCDYFIKFSGALALLNVVPCALLDGQHITEALIEWTLCDHVTADNRTLLQVLVTTFGTALLLANMLIGLCSLW